MPIQKPSVGIRQAIVAEGWRRARPQAARSEPPRSPISNSLNPMTDHAHTAKFSAAALIAMMLLLAPFGVAADDVTILRPGNGITNLDLLGDGTPAMTVVGRRENFNAHSFDVSSFFVRLGDRWEVVPLFGAGKEQDSVTSAGGADCLLHDFRLVQSAPHTPLTLILADRDYGDSFVDVRPVTFRAYQLTRNERSVPGKPTWSYLLRSSWQSAKSYCDVGDAFVHETAWQR